MPATASVEIIVNDGPAVAGIGNVGGALTGLKGPAAEAGAAGSAAMDQIGQGATRNLEHVRLMTEETGVKLPLALSRLLAEAPIVSTALSAVFPVLAATGFISILGMYADKLAAIALRAFDWDGAWKQLLVDEGSLNTAIIAQIKNMQDLEDKYTLLGLIGLPRFSAEQDIASEKQSKANVAVQSAKKALDDYIASLQHAKDTVDIVGSQGEKLGTMLVPHEATAQEIDHQAALVHTLVDAQIALSNATYNSQSAAMAYGTAAGEAYGKKTQDAIAATTGRLAELNAEAQAGLDERMKNQQHYYAFLAESDKADTAAQTAAKQAQLDSWNAAMESGIAKLGIDLGFEVKREAILFKYNEKEQVAAERSIAIWTRGRDKLARDMEGLFNEITSGHIGQAMLRMFEALVFKMVATWAMGMATMQNATGGVFRDVLNLLGIKTGAGGGVGAAVSAAAGGGGGGGGYGITGPGGTAPFFESGGGSSGDPFGYGGAMDSSSSLGMLGLGLSAGGGVQAGAAMPAGARMGVGSTLLGMLGGPVGLGLGLVGGASQIGFGGPMSGALSGGMLGATAGLLGMGLSMGGAGIGGMIAGVGTLLSGPIGWAVLAGSALIGALFGNIFGRGAQRHKRDDIERQAFAQIKQVEDEFNLFTLDYNSAYSQLEQIRTQVSQAMHGLGMRDRMDPWIDAAEKRISATEKDRQTRSQMDFSPAEFESGGFVSPSLAGAGSFAQSSGAGSFFSAASIGRIPSLGSGGAVPAIVHAGEYVFNRNAVQRIGRGNLDSMNAGGSGGGHTFITNISAMDTKSFAQWLRDGGAEEIAKANYRLMAEGGF